MKLISPVLNLCEYFSNHGSMSSTRSLFVTLWKPAFLKKAVNLAIQLGRLLEKGGFRLRKWYSNDREVLAAILESERAKSVVNV